MPVRSESMIFYRFYIVDVEGHVLTRHERYCIDDQEAIQHAQSFNRGYNVEVWDGYRRAAIVAKRDASFESS